MTEADLRQYRALKDEIEDLTTRIREIRQEQSFATVQFGTVKGSCKHFPYTEQTFKISGIDPEEVDTHNKHISDLLIQRERKRDEAINKQIEIEDYIDQIDDPVTRQIFRMHFIDGDNQIKIARITHYTQGRVSQIIKRQLKTNIINT